MLHDITLPMDDRVPVWPGDERFERGWTARLATGTNANVGWMRCSLHNGTHMDAPLHFRDDGVDVGSIDLDDLIGPCVLVEAHGCGAIGPEHFAGIDLQRAERVLVRTRAQRYDPFTAGYAHVTPAAARLLAEAEVRCIGTDAPSMDPMGADPLETHRVLDAGGVRILENLALWGVPAGRYELIALPLRLAGMDGSPVRAVLRAR